MRLRGLRERYIDTRRFTIRRVARQLDADPLSVTAQRMKLWQYSRRVQPSTLHTEVVHLREYCGWAIDQGIIDHDPAELLIVPKLTRRLPRPAPEDLLMDAVGEAPPDIRLMLVLAGWEGLRAGELAGLDRADILATSVPPVMVVRGKGGRERVVPISPSVLLELSRYGLPHFGPIFPRRDGQPGHNSATRISNIVSTYLHEMGLPFTLHQCRHRFGTELYRNSRDLRMVQETLGHASPTTTAGYAAYTPRNAVDAVRRITGRLNDRN